MSYTNTRSRLRGRELNYGLDVEQFLKYEELRNARITHQVFSFYYNIIYQVSPVSSASPASVTQRTSCFYHVIYVFLIIYPAIITPIM